MNQIIFSLCNIVIGCNLHINWEIGWVTHFIKATYFRENVNILLKTFYEYSSKKMCMASRQDFTRRWNHVKPTIVSKPTEA